LDYFISTDGIIHRFINSFEQLQKEVDRSVLLYNTEKLHSKLQRKSPNQFENEYLCINNSLKTQTVSLTRQIVDNENNFLNASLKVISRNQQ